MSTTIDAPRHTAQAPFYTPSGRVLDLLDPDPADIDISDIATLLAGQRRFGGQLHRDYSVCDHALLCRELMLEHGAPELADAALHHDSHEAYAQDIITPVRRVIGPEYPALVARLNDAIAVKFDIPVELFDHPLVVDVDRAALHLEAAAFGYRRPLVDSPPPRWIPLQPCRLAPLADAAERFVAAHERHQTTSPLAFTGRGLDTLPEVLTP